MTWHSLTPTQCTAITRILIGLFIPRMWLMKSDYTDEKYQCMTRNSDWIIRYICYTIIMHSKSTKAILKQEETILFFSLDILKSLKRKPIQQLFQVVTLFLTLKPNKHIEAYPHWSLRRMLFWIKEEEGMMDLTETLDYRSSLLLSMAIFCCTKGSVAVDINA